MVNHCAGALVCLLAITGQSDEGVLLEFTADWCGACRAVESTVQRLAGDGYPVRRVDVDRERETAAQFRVTAVPCFVMVRNGRETDRVVGGASYARLVQMFGRDDLRDGSGAGSAPPAAVVRGQSPAPAPYGLPRPLAALAKGLRERPAALRDMPASAPPRGPAASAYALDPGSVPLGNSPPAAEPSRPAPAAAGDRSEFHSADVQLALTATVRLRVADESGHSLGTGTIIDTHGDEALVATCAHIFRESKGKGPIHVDLFAPQARTVAGTLISCDMERDVAMVAISPGTPVRAVRVAPPACQVACRQPVFSIGCDKGTSPSVRTSVITAIDRYTGAPNIEVAGMPVDGRSGGGLFSADGMLIGICNAADPQDQEGIFASLPNIHWELDRIGQRAIYDPRGAASLAVASPPPAPQAPVSMASSVPAAAGASGLLPPEMPDSRLAIQPLAASAEHDTEVICIIRSRANPQGSEQLFVLDRPSRDLLDRLAHESQRQGAASLARTPPHPPTRSTPQDRSSPFPAERNASSIIRAQSKYR